MKLLSASHRFLGRGEDLLRRVEIRESLRQQDRSLVECITRDGADHGFLKIMEPLGCVNFHGCSKSTEATLATKGWLKAITF